MPEYLAPGVFVEEVSFRNKTIEGSSTSTTGMVGATCFGPEKGEPELLTSFADFERIYGGLDPIEFSDGTLHNYLAHGVRGYFDEGGKRLYVARVSDGTGGASSWAPSPPAGYTFSARYAGAAGNFGLGGTFQVGQNIVSSESVDGADVAVLRGAAAYDTVVVRDTASPPQSPPVATALYWLEPALDAARGVQTFRLNAAGAGSGQLLTEMVTNAADFDIRIVTLSVTVGSMGRFGQEQTFDNLAFHPTHRQSLSQVFAAEPANRATALSVPLVFTTTDTNGVDIADALAAQLANGIDDLDASLSAAARSFRVELAGGTDGARPGAGDYEGDNGAIDGLKSGLRAFEDLENISIVAAPGSTFGYENGFGSDASAIIRHLISHCERMRYRVAVIDSGDAQSLGQVRSLRGSIDSKHAAFYYPWVRVLDPVSETEIDLPPSGFMAGIYARNDVERGVYKAPANEVIRGAIGLELLLNKSQQEVLNPEGINCLRYFEGRGYRVWGARTATSDSEWKYLNVRRYFAFLESSIERGTQFAVFEPNGDQLWANVRSTIEDFLFNEWKSNHLLGTKPEEAFFVRCDRTTMTQNDLDNGRLVCLVGVSPLRPAEFVIFRIGQKTADSRS